MTKLALGKKFGKKIKKDLEVRKLRFNFVETKRKRR